jgi:hypothetical protein
MTDLPVVALDSEGAIQETVAAIMRDALRFAETAQATQGITSYLAIGPDGKLKRGSGTFINVRDFDIIPSTTQVGATTDYRIKIQAIIDVVAAEGGGIIWFPAGYYLVGDPGLDLKSKVTLLGVAREGGAVFVRNGAYSILNSLGVSILTDGTGAGHIRRWSLQNFSMEGGAYEAPLTAFRASSLCEIRNVRFSGSKRQLLQAYEFFDSRIDNSRFTHADDDTGTYFAVELLSGLEGSSNWEFTNQIHFKSCVWEDNIGKSLLCKTFITNEIYLADCKIENLACNQSGQITAQSCANLRFNNVQITTRGTAGNLITDVLNISSASLVYGRFTWEHQGLVALHANVDPDPTKSSATPTAASVIRFASLSNCRPCDIHVFMGGNTFDKLQDTKAIHRSGDISQSTVKAEGWTNTMLKTMTNDGAANSTLEKVHIRGSTTLMGHRYQSSIPGINNTQYWEFGRINGDGAGNQRFRVKHSNDIDEVSVLELTHERDVYLAAGLRSSAARMSATGTTQGTAAPISAMVTRIYVDVATTGVNDGLLLPIGPPGKEVEVFNLTAQTLQVYPQTGVTINGLAANTPVTILPGASARFVMGPTDATGWRVARASTTKTGWGAPAGTLSRAAYTSYTGQVVSAAYVQAEIQALDDAVKLLSRTVAALLTDLHASTGGNRTISL